MRKRMARVKTLLQNPASRGTGPLFRKLLNHCGKAGGKREIWLARTHDWQALLGPVLRIRTSFRVKSLPYDHRPAG
jgi:hypothetical protein